MVPHGAKTSTYVIPALSPAFGTLANDSLFPFFRPCEGQGPQVSSRCCPVLVIISIGVDALLESV